jgi:hypothetical protein
MMFLTSLICEIYIDPDNDDLILVEAEELYEKMLENFTDKLVTSLSNNVSHESTFAQKELYGEEGSILILIQVKMIRITQPMLCYGTVLQLQNDESNGDASR